MSDSPFAWRETKLGLCLACKFLVFRVMEMVEMVVGSDNNGVVKWIVVSIGGGDDEDDDDGSLQLWSCLGTFSL